jgi:hypothetical protein
MVVFPRMYRALDRCSECTRLMQRRNTSAAVPPTPRARADPSLACGCSYALARSLDEALELLWERRLPADMNRHALARWCWVLPRVGRRLATRGWRCQAAVAVPIRQLTKLNRSGAGRGP